MRRRTAQGLTIALLVSLGTAQRLSHPGSARYAAPQNVILNSRPSAATAKPVSGKAYQVGTASWYGEDFDGKLTASGEPFNMYDMTAAHLTLPLGTFVKVTNLRNRRVVIVRINDRGPIVPGRIIDVSYSAAKMLKFQAQGTQRVRLDVVPSRRIPAIMALLQQPALAR